MFDACFSGSGVILGIVTGLAEMTGDLFTAMLFVVILLMILAISLQMPLEVSAILVLPFLITCYACVPNFTAVTGVTLIYLGVIVAKNFIIR